MRTKHAAYFEARTLGRKALAPFIGQIELTYRCSFRCVHCYCRGSAGQEPELSTAEFKRLLDELRAEGCLWLTFTGGDCLLREDFRHLYAYAKQRGFIVSIMTNGFGFDRALLAQLVKSPPFQIEITLNALTPGVFDRITQTKDALPRVLANIRALARRKLPVSIQSNCMRMNRHEVVPVKRWADALLGRSETESHFHYDYILHPTLGGDLTPCRCRLDFKEMAGIIRQDPDMLKEYRKDLACPAPQSPRGGDSLYWCDAWTQQFFISPSGRLRFCSISDDFSSDLRKVPFRKAFYGMAAKIRRAKFKTASKCRTCGLRPYCGYCPPRAFLETGNEESPIPYLCKLARDTARAMAK